MICPSAGKGLQDSRETFISKYSNMKTNLVAILIFAGIVEGITNAQITGNPAEGNDLWIVYYEGLNTHADRATPTLPFSSGRTILTDLMHAAVIT